MSLGNSTPVGGTAQDRDRATRGWEGKVFVYDPQKQLGIKINHGVINSSDIESLIDTKDEARLKDLIEKHYEYTDSKKSKAILDNWDKEKLNIVRVIPKMYKKLISEYKAV